jgi:hypothetical protein
MRASINTHVGQGIHVYFIFFASAVLAANNRAFAIISAICIIKLRRMFRIENKSELSMVSTTPTIEISPI